MKAVFRLLTILLLFGSLLFLNQVSYAEEGDTVQEVIAEATCPIGGANTPAKAEAQALLLAKKNALEQAGTQNLTLENIDSLPEDVFTFIVLDKKKVMDGTTLGYWVQIKALVKPDHIESAVKAINPIWGGPAEYCDEWIFYQNGKETGRGKTWTKNGWERSEMDGMITITKYEKKDKVFTARSWHLKNNKYFEAEPYKMIKEEVALGTEQIGDVVAQKKRITYIYPDLKSSVTNVEWIDSTTKCTLKVESEASGYRSVSVYQNHQISPQDASLFVIPVGYTKCASLEDLLVASSGQTDPLKKATDAALESAAQKVLDNAISGLFKF